jgi:hypothetical protein
MTRPLPLSVLIVGLGLAAGAGCSNNPELKNHLTPELRQADYPALLPTEDLIPLLPAPEQESRELENNLDARARNLQRRADALRRATH